LTKDRIQLTGTDSTSKAVHIHINPAGKDTFELGFTPSVGGTHIFKISVDGKPLSQIPAEGAVIELPKLERKVEQLEQSKPKDHVRSKSRSEQKIEQEQIKTTSPRKHSEPKQSEPSPRKQPEAKIEPEQPKPKAARPTNNAPTLKQRPDNFQTVAFLEKVHDGLASATMTVYTDEKGNQKEEIVQPAKNKTNYIVLIDKSQSMSTKNKKGVSRWTQSANVVSVLATSCIASSPEGIAVYLFGSPGRLDIHTGVKSPAQVTELFSRTKPAGTTCLEGALQAAFNSHIKRGIPLRTEVPTSILVITDGQPNSKSAVIDTLSNFSKQMVSADELSVSFLQVGDDSLCGAFFGKLNKPKNKSKFASCPVDCLTSSQINNIDEFVNTALGQ